MNWKNLAITVACGLEYERQCDRGELLDENALVREVAKFIQANTRHRISLEHNHPDLPGTRRVDLIARGPQAQTIETVLEAKFVLPNRPNRGWLREVAEDALRLELLENEMEARTDRVLVVGGTVKSLEARIRSQTYREAGQERPFLPVILTDDEDSFQRVTVRDCPTHARKLFTKLRSATDGNLPVSYQVKLAADFAVHEAETSICVLVWLLRRSRNRSSFDPTTEWT